MEHGQRPQAAHLPILLLLRALGQAVLLMTMAVLLMTMSVLLLEQPVLVARSPVLLLPVLLMTMPLLLLKALLLQGHDATCFATLGRCGVSSPFC